MLEMPVVSINVCLVKGRREGASSLGANLSDVFEVEEWRFIRQAFSNIFTINMHFSLHAIVHFADLLSKELSYRL